MNAFLSLGRLVLLIVAGLCAYPVAAQDSVNDYYSSDPKARRIIRGVEFNHMRPAVEAHNAGSYERAFNNYRFILGYSPNHPMALIGITDVCLKWRDRRCSAEGYLERALSSFPDTPSPHFAKAMYEQKTGKLDAAIASYLKTIEIAPTYRDAYYNLGLAYFDKHDLVSANRHAQKAYAMGHPLGGLRQKLQKANAWNPGDSDPAQPAPAPDSGQPGVTAAPASR